MTDVSMLATAKDWLSVISTGGFIALALALNYLRTQFVSKDEHGKSADKLADVLKNLSERIDTRAGADRVSETGKRIDALEDRVQRVEGELQHVPGKDTAHRMEMAIARLEGRLETMDERLKPVAAMASRMQDYLLEGARDR